MTDFKSLNLAAPINSALEELGYTTPTPIQAQAIPDVLKGRDLMGIAQTGTGKTAAFSLPLLNHICVNDHEPPKKGARALILAPTRELASQIAESIREYGKNMEFLSVTVVFGGVPIQRQIKRLSGGNDIIVATPGRLIDLLDRRCVTLKDIEFLILDEADQMMDMGFIHALKKIVPLLPKERQTLFFSATMVPAIKKLAGQFTNNPVTVSVSPANSTAEKVEQRLSFVDKAEKQNLLGLSLLEPDVERSLVFTRTKHGADRVVKRLAQIGIDSMAIHGNKSQAQRQKALLAFREDRIKVLVATDVAARGIDIPGITHVFNFEIPNVPEQYVHRIGRTARANRSGVAHAFVDKEERAYLKDIQKLLKTTIPVVELPEDFVQKARALKTRAPIVKPAEPKHEPRKGRGKSKKKSRFSKDRDNKSGGSRDGQRRDGQGRDSQSRDTRGRDDRGSQSRGGQNRNDGQKASERPRSPSNEKRDDRPRSERPRSDRPRSDKPREDRPRNDRPRSDKPRSDKPRSDRPRSDKPRGERPQGERPARKKSWGSDSNTGDRRRKAPSRGGDNKSTGQSSGKPGGESRADRKAKNQEAHAKQHSRKPRRDDGPLATLEGARLRVRSLKAQSKDAIEVQIRGGDYSIRRTVVFGHEDSGTQAAPVVYKAFPEEKPVFSGGVELSGWTQCTEDPEGMAPEAKGKLWVVKVPKPAGEPWVIRSLYDGGSLLNRARSGSFKYAEFEKKEDSNRQGKKLTSVLDYEGKPLPAFDRTIRYRDVDLRDWPNPSLLLE